MKSLLKRRKGAGAVLAAVLLLLQSLAILTPPARAEDAPVETKGWHNTGITINKGGNNVNCFDGTRPDTLLVSNAPYYSEPVVGTYTYNFATGEVKQLSNRNLVFCNESSGLLFSQDFGANTATRLGSNPADEANLQFVPSAMPADGTLQVYGLKDRRLFYSPDGGKTVLERARQFAGQIESVATTAMDGRVVYIIVKGDDIPADSYYNFVPYYYTVYASGDTGQTWEKRYTGRTSLEAFTPGLEIMPGRATPSSWVVLSTHTGFSPSSSRTTFNLSTDGGQTFHQIGFRGRDYSLLFYRTNNRLVRLRTSVYSEFAPNEMYETSEDGGKTWFALSLPFQPVFGTNLLQAQNAPHNLFAIDKANLWYSSNGGLDWKQIATLDPGTVGYNVFISPYSPTTLVAVKEKQIYTLSLPDVDKTLTSRVQLSFSPMPNFYEQTGHLISPLFQRYWEQNGGLAQFGYPRTEAMRELNQTEGKIYTVQYFERARFEYHPENAGSPFEVLLGLLGNQLTAGRENEKPFQQVAGPTGPLPSDIQYYPQTGHYLTYGFKAYWEQNGGLYIYGYPVSEEFQEVNPDTGKTYTVQYFERARFEYHPENKGTRYEVLLGLLGNALLRDKGWLS